MGGEQVGQLVGNLTACSHENEFCVCGGEGGVAYLTPVFIHQLIVRNGLHRSGRVSADKTRCGHVCVCVCVCVCVRGGGGGGH